MLDRNLHLKIKLISRYSMKSKSPTTPTFEWIITTISQSSERKFDSIYHHHQSINTQSNETRH